MIGRKIKVDDTTLATSRRKFARVCVEIDLNKPLIASYKLRGEEGHFQYEGLHDLCFSCGKYGHKEIKCPLSTALQTKPTAGEGGRSSDAEGSKEGIASQQSAMNGDPSTKEGTSSAE